MRAGLIFAAIREHGLRVEGLEPALPPLRLNATDDPREVGPVDVTLICTKIYDIEDAARAILPVMGPDSFAIAQQRREDRHHAAANPRSGAGTGTACPMCPAISTARRRARPWRSTQRD